MHKYYHYAHTLPELVMCNALIDPEDPFKTLTFFFVIRKSHIAKPPLNMLY